MDRLQFDRWVFLVNALGIVYDAQHKKILIGKRENDEHIAELSRGFPGGRPAYQEDIEYYLKLEIKKKTGLDVDVQKIIFAKTYPEKREFMSLYYLCEVSGGSLQAWEKFSEVKWINPSEVAQYFTTSLHPELLKYLKELDAGV